MAFGDGIEGIISVSDAKGKSGSFSFNFPDNVDIPLVTGDFLPSTAVLVDDVIGGKITGASASINVNLDGVTLKDAPITGSDVEEGATFSFRSTAGAPTSFRLPTFDESFGLETGDAVDLAAPAVDALVQRIIAGDTQGLTTVRFADSHGNNVSSITRAKGNFRKSRRR